ncbi:MAG TPA: oxygen-independent coproporphyrinogen III oxidase [Candidatus Acidoferrales bacterium]|nr:oxygen-independent coproporphyrinogen III oxidase [Candidatus Acidoferrales bacterium]
MASFERHTAPDDTLREMDLPDELLQKYNRPGPRYTSYPPAPAWRDDFDRGELERAYLEAEAAGSDVSLYVHIPFCESLCLFCACNVVIQKDHAAAASYLDLLRREIRALASRISRERPVVQLHWGGGTPTYLAPKQLEDLFDDLCLAFRFASDAEMGVEIDPRVTSRAHLETLRRLGFNRLSLGIQDFHLPVQEAVHRVQPYELTREVVDAARALGFASLNVDLIYGLPHQTPETFAATADRVLELAPDRIALFSYAHVPWLKKQQGSFAAFLPSDHQKFRVFRAALAKFLDAGYLYIGMDHFARPDDELARAQRDRTLHRNFQGYSTRAGADLYGIGVSAIGRVGSIYAQNFRDLPRYQAAIEAGGLATMRGYRLSADDRVRGAVISRLLCHAVVKKAEIENQFGIEFDSYFRRELDRLQECEQDGLARLLPGEIRITGRGRIFMRNIAMAFDRYLPEAGARPRFSQTL